MATLHAQETLEIDAPMDLVMAQFGDVDHHSETQPHRGVEFAVISESNAECRYRQTTRIGPLRLKQEITLDKTQSNPQVNRITKGQFSGGSISFAFDEADTGTVVTATVEAELTGINRLLKPLLRRNVAGALRSALVEDKADIESGRYPWPDLGRTGGR